MKRCFKCKELKEFSAFHRYVRNKDGLQSWCKQCQAARHNDDPERWHEYGRKTRIRNPLASLVGSCRASSKKYKEPCQITVEVIETKLEQQRGLCFWLGIPVLVERGTGHPQQISVDRLDCSIGYTLENTVITTKFANIGRNDTKAEEFGVWVKSLKKQLVLAAAVEATITQETT